MNTIKTNTKSEIIIKKSIFIAYLFNVQNEDEAKKHISEIKDLNSDFSHNVYAYNLKTMSSFSDDGEPKNTAGKPIYELLKKKGLVNVLIIVSRKFGGIKLGAGGLIRGYLSSAKDVIDNSVIEEFIVYENYDLTLTLNQYNKNKSLLDKYNIISKKFSDNSVILTFEIIKEEIEFLNKKILP